MTASRSWLADCPAWEEREVQRHYREDLDSLHSKFLPNPIPYREALQRRQAGEPLEYILNHCHVGPLSLQTDSRALIPRPETETMLRKVVAEIESLPAGPLVDCGTGTGLIAAWLAKNTSRRVVATDIDPEALVLAKENFMDNSLEVPVVQSDRLAALSGGLAAVVANLPYVLPGAEKLEEEVKNYEPHRALFIPGPPLQFYGDLFSQALNRLRPGGQLWLEATPLLIEKFTDLLRDFNCTIEIFSHRDLAGRLRYLQVKLC